MAVARSLVVDPMVILADEPTGALDTTTGYELMELFTELVDDQGVTVVLVTHEEEVAAYSRRVLRMRDGRIVEDSAGPLLKDVSPDGSDEADVASPPKAAEEVSG